MTEPTFHSIYKPKTIDEFYLKDAIKKYIKLLIDVNEIQILLTGNKCSGKTTMIQVIISTYYGSEYTHIRNDVLFINNLKEQGIIFYRNELKTFCQSYSSIYKKKKIVVIDDMDVIPEHGQHIIRNYIDKYKNNVHFIMSCNNQKRVIDSIQSRLAIIKLETPVDISPLIKKIVSANRIVLTEKIENFLIKYSNYSIRTIINYLEKIKILGDVVTDDNYHEIIADISFIEFNNYFGFIKSGDLPSAIKTISALTATGYSVIDILEYMLLYVKMTDELTEKYKYEIVTILCKYIYIFHNLHEDEIELVLLTNDVLKSINV
jgi:DNA polymerase III delta prime subunit